MNRDMHLAAMPRGGGYSVRDQQIVTPQQLREQKIQRNEARAAKHAQLVEVVREQLDTLHELTREQQRRKIEVLVSTPYTGPEENRRLFDYCEAVQPYHSKFTNAEMTAAAEMALTSFNTELKTLGHKPILVDDPLATLLARMAFVNNLWPFDQDGSALLAVWRVLKSEGCLSVVAAPPMPSMPLVLEEVGVDPEIEIQAEMAKTPNTWDKEKQPARWEAYERQNRYEAIDRIERKAVTEAHYIAVGTEMRDAVESLGLTLNNPGRCYEQIVDTFQKLKPRQPFTKAVIRQICFRLFGDQIPQQDWEKYWSVQELNNYSMIYGSDHMTSSEFARFWQGSIPSLNEGGAPTRSPGV